MALERLSPKGLFKPGAYTQVVFGYKPELRPWLAEPGYLIEVEAIAVIDEA